MDRFPYLCPRAIVWLALTMALSVPAVRAQIFPTVPLNLSGTGHAVVPSIGVGPGGDVNVVWLDSGAILFRRSPQGGAAFSGTMVVATTNLPSQASQPQIAVTSSSVYIAWAGTNSGGGGDIFFSSMAIGGSSGFSAPVNVSKGQGIASGGSAPVPRIATDPNGGVDIVWGQSAAFFARTTNNGGSFAVTPLSNSPMASVSPRVAINAQGTVYVVWENAASCPTITFARSIDKGGSFTNYPVDDQLIVGGVAETGCTSDVQIALGASNTIHLLWANDSPIQDLIATYQTDSGGSSFAGFDQAHEQGFQNLSSTSSFTPQMAIDSNGDIDVAWIGDFQTNGGPPAVYFSRSTTGGTQGSFSNPLPLTTPPAGNAKPTGFPQIAVESSGAIDIIWQQASAANPGNAYDIALAHSADGTNFKTFTLDNSPTTTGNTGQLAVDGNNDAYVVWLGNSGSSADILLSGDSTALTDPGFSLTISAAGQVVLPGSTVSYNVTVNSVGGFNQSVTLSCSNPPAGAQCSFNPPTVTLATSSATSTLTVTLPATIAAGTHSLNVTGTGGGSSQSAPTQFVVSALTASVAPTSATISVGGSASFTISLNSTNGFTGPATLGCVGAPTGVSCAFNPGSVSIPGSATLTVSVSIKPSGSASRGSPKIDPGGRPEGVPRVAAWMWGIGLAIFFAAAIAREVRRRAAGEFSSRVGALDHEAAAFARTFALILLVAALAAGLASCGGSTNGGGGGGGSSVTFPLTVQAQSNSTTTRLQTISITVP